MDEIELIPCRHCECEAGYMGQYGSFMISEEWRAECQNRACRMRTPIVDTKREAAQIWNRQPKHKEG
jgi:hypothetical protein